MLNIRPRAGGSSPRATAAAQGLSWAGSEPVSEVQQYLRNVSDLKAKGEGDSSRKNETPSGWKSKISSTF